MKLLLLLQKPLAPPCAQSRAAFAGLYRESLPTSGVIVKQIIQAGERVPCSAHLELGLSARAAHHSSAMDAAAGGGVMDTDPEYAVPVVARQSSGAAAAALGHGLWINAPEVAAGAEPSCSFLLTDSSGTVIEPYEVVTQVQWWQRLAAGTITDTHAWRGAIVIVIAETCGRFKQGQCVAQVSQTGLVVWQHEA
jgi:hypothetical protein